MVIRVNHKFHVVLTLVQVVLTQCFKYKAKRSSSVDTSPGSVDTRDSSQNTFWPSWDSSVDTRDLPRTPSGLFWDSRSTLAQAVSTLVALPEQNTWSGSVDTRDLPITPSGLFWDSRSTLAQAVSTLVALPEQNTWSGVTRKHVSCSDSLLPHITI
ncbi:hypothetical protein Taro_018230 [Colocasia esculenta]|uniref:Uncharacterized protein n=1 Tax=Colocasia esculenta TaxID=4460 RepID=A0A843UQF2_COLES|nr:hypothetical protein [Colocasia esculenta]